MPLFLGLDVGTQGCKAIVLDSSKQLVVGRGSKPYSVRQTTVPGRAEQDPATWIEGAADAIADALEASGLSDAEIAGVGVSGQQHGMVALDAEGRVIRPAKLWCDVESAKEAAALSEFRGISTPPGFTAPKVMWMKANEPENFEKMSHLLLPHDYFNYYLTGNMVMECGDASGTGVFDTAARRFDDDALDFVDARFAGCLPGLIGPNDLVGKVTPAAAASLGITEGAAVACGSGDNMMSALGAGAVQPGIMVMSLGTSGTLFGCSDVPIVDLTGSVAPFCDSTGQWLPLLCTMNCTVPAEEVRQSYGMTREEISALAAEVPPGCNGVNFVPYLTGERTPNWPHSSGTIAGLRPGHISPGLLYRAALEGATYTLLAGARQMQAEGLEFKELRLVGGGSKSPLWRQIIADAFQLPIRFPIEPESAALGGALQAAAVHSGVNVSDYVASHPPPLSDDVVEPNPENAAAYEEAFQRHVSLGKLLFEQ